MEAGERQYSPVEPEILAEFKPGIYLHYKGNLYEGSRLGLDSNYPERTVAIYVALGPNTQKDTITNYVRTLTDKNDDSWNDFVHRDGSDCNGEQDHDVGDDFAPRYRYLGPQLEAWMNDVDPWSKI